MTALRCLLLILLAAPGVADAQFPTSPDFEPVLIPVWVENPIPGAHGSVWSTILTIGNTGDSEISLENVPAFECSINAWCGPAHLAAMTTTRVSLEFTRTNIVGYHVWVESSKLEDLAVTLRAQDLSRQSQTWGTNLPVTSRKDWFADRFSFADVTAGDEFRTLLRLYDNGRETADSVIVRIYRVDSGNFAPGGADGDVLISEQTVALPSPGDIYPGFASLPIEAPADTNAEERPLLRVEVEPLSDEQEFWGLITVTNNETQHITVITPH